MGPTLANALARRPLATSTSCITYRPPALSVIVLRPFSTGTVSVLSVAVMVSVGFGNNILNSVDNTREWGRRISGIDFFVRGFMPDTGMRHAGAPTGP